MMEIDRNALICDMAETYNVYDLRSLPVGTIAAMAAGLRETSRIKTIQRQGVIFDTNILLAKIHDLLNEFIWSLGKYGEDAERPVRLENAIYGIVEEKMSEVKGFMSAEDYEEARRNV